MTVFWARTVAVAMGGAVGAVGRFWITGWVMRFSRDSFFPWGTFVVNVAGTFILGLFLGATTTGRFAVSPNMRAFVAIGVLGALTTFSTFAYEIIEAARVGDYRIAFLNAGGSLALGLAACWLGLILGQRL